MASLLSNENACLYNIDTSQCQKLTSNSARNSDVLFFYFNTVFFGIRDLFEVLYECRNVIGYSLMCGAVLYLLYKSYLSPVLYKKELTELGFEDIPKGSDRLLRISRAQNARRLGSKLPPPYPNGWFAVAESGDLKVGDLQAVDVLGQNLCVYRTADGIAHCVDAYCPHLGAHLAGGSVAGDCIQCPFHKWTFDSHGTCVSVPGQDLPPKGVSIKTWRTREYDGAVWVWYDAADEEPRWLVEEPRELGTWGYRGRNEFIVSSHIQDIPENGADVAHLNAVHSPSLISSLGERYPFLLNIIGQHTWSAAWEKGEDHTAVMKLGHNYKFGKYGVFQIDARALQLGPGHVRLDIKTALGPILISQSVTPLSPLQQRVVHRFYSPSWNAVVGSLFVRGESYMFERDVVIWNRKCFVSSPAYVKTDKTIRAFRSWYSQFYSESSISFRDAIRGERSLEW